MNDTILSIAFDAFFMLAGITTVFFLAVMVIDEERKGVRK